MYQKGAYCSGVKVFNRLPTALKDISSEPDKFKIALKNFLEIHSFYSLDEFLDKQWYYMVNIRPFYTLSEITVTQLVK